jgi:hypothetical protein
VYLKRPCVNSLFSRAISAEYPPTPQDGECRACGRVQERTSRAVPDYQDARRASEGRLRPDRSLGPLGEGDLPVVAVAFVSIYFYPYSTNEDQEEDCLGQPANDCVIAENVCRREKTCTAFERRPSSTIAQSPCLYRPLMESSDRIF